MQPATRDQYITAVVNELFQDVPEGFINSHNEPAMTTPTVTLTPGAAEVVITGSTICLSC